MLSNRTLVILILLVSSFVFSSNDAFACSNHPKKEVVSSNKVIEKSCCKETVMEQGKVKKCNCNHGNDQEESNHCGDCNCCVTAPATYLSSSSSFYLQLIEQISFYNYVWSYRQPESDQHFNSIWQPPQFS